MKTRSFLVLIASTFACGLMQSPAADFPAGSPAFITNFQKLQALQKSTGKPAVVVFSAVWCGPCQTMKKQVYPSAEVKPYHDKFLWVYLDADDASNKKAMEKFGVQGIPHIEFLDATGKSLQKQVGSVAPEAFAKILEETLAKAPPAAVKTPAVAGQ